MTQKLLNLFIFVMRCSIHREKSVSKKFSELEEIGTQAEARTTFRIVDSIKKLNRSEKASIALTSSSLDGGKR